MKEAVNDAIDLDDVSNDAADTATRLECECGSIEDVYSFRAFETFLARHPSHIVQMQNLTK